MNATAEYWRDVTAELIARCAEVSGDDHLIHLDADYGATTPYGRRIGHGAVLVEFMSVRRQI
jgi:3-hydroxybutyryl-CoA dehydratase